MNFIVDLFIKKKIFNFFLIVFFSVYIFLLLNPMKYWYEGNIENIYFIYNSLLSSLKIKPIVIDYPGTPSYIINGFFYKTFLTDYSSFNDIINNFKIDEFLDSTLRINKLIQLTYIVIFFVTTFKILNELNNKHQINTLLTISLILSAPMIENFQLARIENDALCFMSLSLFFFIKFIKKNYQSYFFSFIIFFTLMMFTKVIYIFFLYLLPLLVLIYKKNSIIGYFNFKSFFFYYLLINIPLVIFLYIVQYSIDRIYIVSIIFSLATYGLVIPLLVYFFSLIKFNLKKLFLISFLSILPVVLILIITNSNFSHGYYVIFPFDLLKQHLRGAHVADIGFFFQIFLIFKKILINFSEFKISLFEIFILSFFIFNLIFLRLVNPTNSAIILLYFLYKIIFNIKYYLYYDIITFFLLILFLANSSLIKSRYSYFLTLFILMISFSSSYNVLAKEKYRLNNAKNSMIVFNNFCSISNLSKKKFSDLDPPEHYSLYYAPDLMTYETINKICLKKKY